MSHNDTEERLKRESLLSQLDLDTDENAQGLRSPSNYDDDKLDAAIEDLKKWDEVQKANAPINTKNSNDVSSEKTKNNSTSKLTLNSKENEALQKSLDSDANFYYASLKRDYCAKLVRSHPHIESLFEKFESDMSRQGIKVGSQGFVTALEKGFAGIKWSKPIHNANNDTIPQKPLVHPSSKKVTADNTQITAGVGAGSAKNIKADVLTIQKALLDIGVLSSSDFSEESAAVKKSPSKTVEKEKIAKTIKAIEVFQEEVLHWTWIDGNISGPDSPTLENIHAEHMDADYVQKRMAMYPSLKAKRDVKAKQEAKQKKTDDHIRSIKQTPISIDQAQNFINEIPQIQRASQLDEYVIYNPAFAALVLSQLDSANQNLLCRDLINNLTDNELMQAGPELLLQMKVILSYNIVPIGIPSLELMRLNALLGQSSAQPDDKEENNSDSENKTTENINLDDSIAIAANGSDPLREIIKTILGIPITTFLGNTAGSKITASFEVNIPTPAAAVTVVLGGSFEQERKVSEKTLVTHKLESKLGIGIRLPAKAPLPEVDGSGTLFTFFEITAENLEDAVNLIYYGIYKLGRLVGDVSNDWRTVAASSGASMPAAVAIHYGLNYLYGDDDFISPDQAEDTVKVLEDSIFDRQNNGDAPFNTDNKNELAFGGGFEVKAEAELANVDASVGGKFTDKRVVNANTLNETGIHGKQVAGFWDDYELASLGQRQLELAAAFSVEGFKFEGKHLFNWSEFVEEKVVIVRKHRKKVKTNVWRFTGYENQMTAKLGNLSKLDNDAAIAIFTQVIEKLVADYENKKSNANKEDKDANLPTISRGSLVANMLTEITAGIGYEIAKPNIDVDVLKILEQITLGSKLTVTPTKTDTKTKLVLTIGNEKSIEIDAKVAKLNFLDMDVLGRFTILDL